VLGAVSRKAGKVHLRVVKDSSSQSLLPATLEEAPEGARVMTDEWGAYVRLGEEGRPHSTVCHGKREWARDDDGDGFVRVALPDAMRERGGVLGHGSVLAVTSNPTRT